MTRTVRVYDREFVQRSRAAIHPRVAEALRDLPRGRLLDLPAGSGALAYRLHKDGFAVTACDIHPEQFEPAEIPCVRGDLGGRLPFEDASFDCATFIEGPEHAENPAHAFREFARVLKPGGRLVVSLPNYGNIEKRLKMLFFGSFEKGVSQERLRQDFGGDPAMLHLVPMAWAQLKFFLESAGFRVERLLEDRAKPRQRLLWPLALLVRLVSRLRGRRARERYWLDEANSGTILMGGNTLIVVARLETKGGMGRAGAPEPPRDGAP